MSRRFSRKIPLTKQQILDHIERLLRQKVKYLECQIKTEKDVLETLKQRKMKFIDLKLLIRRLEMGKCFNDFEIYNLLEPSEHFIKNYKPPIDPKYEATFNITDTEDKLYPSLTLSPFFKKPLQGLMPNLASSLPYSQRPMSSVCDSININAQSSQTRLEMQSIPLMYRMSGFSPPIPQQQQQQQQQQNYIMDDYIFNKDNNVTFDTNESSDDGSSVFDHTHEVTTTDTHCRFCSNPLNTTTCNTSNCISSSKPNVICETTKITSTLRTEINLKPKRKSKKSSSDSDDDIYDKKSIEIINEETNNEYSAGDEFKNIAKTIKNKKSSLKKCLKDTAGRFKF